MLLFCLRYVLLVSGFGLGDPNVLFPLQLLTDFFSGQLGDEKDQERFSRVIRVIIAGNSIGQTSKDFFSKVCKAFYLSITLFLCYLYMYFYIKISWNLYYEFS